MPTTIIGQTTAYPSVFLPPILELADSWQAAANGNYRIATDLEFVSCAVHASSSSVSTCEVKRRYGKRKLPHEIVFQTAMPANLYGKILRFSVMGQQGQQVQFVGVIESRSAEVAADPNSATPPMGEESFLAYGGLRLLQKMDVYQSVWLRGTSDTARVDWIPAMNARDRRELLVGNATQRATGKKVYGGTDVWTHLEYVQYLLDNFIQQTNGPKWKLSGQFDALGKIKTTIEFSQNSTVAAMLKELIPVKYGLDYFVRPSGLLGGSGFEIYVFSLTDQDATIGGVTLAKNKSLVEVRRDAESDLSQVRIVESGEKRYDFIRVQGKRIVICGSLRGNSAGGQRDSGGLSLVRKWPTSLEIEYDNAGDGSITDAQLADKARQRERYRDVYQHLGAPVDWDMDGGQWAMGFSLANTLVPQGPASRQNNHRETLHYIPLKVDFDYSTDPPTDNTLGLLTPDHDHPRAWVIDETNATEPGAFHYIACHHNGMHVSVPFADWGVVIDASPNHKLGLNHFASTQITNTQPLYDYQTAICTIAIESDHRLQIQYAVPPNLAAGDGSAMVVQDNSAELHILLAGTVVDVDQGGHLQTSGGTTRILRNDTDRIGLIACGLLVRYINERVKAQLDWKGHAPWGNLIGSILDVVVTGSNRQRVGAPITSVEWTMGQTPRTVVRTGYV